MKLFLSTSIVAMIAAGIFGVYDFSNDVKHGNYIVYEVEEDVNISSFGTERRSNAISLNNVALAVEESFTSNTKRKVIKEEYFSRGEPIEVVEEHVSQEPTIVPAKLETEKVKAPEKVKLVETKTRTEKTEKRKFSYNLYSRGRPPKIEEEEIVAVVDSVKE